MVPGMRSKAFSIAIIASCQVAAMSLWFSASAVLPALTAQFRLTPFAQAALTSSVQLGFVIGCIASALLGLPDRVDPRRLFSLAAIAGAVANVGLLAIDPSSAGALVLRAVTGVCMAGIYPVGMKLASTWAKGDMGLMVGILVGALTLGSASPHLFNAVGGIGWQAPIALAAIASLAAAGGIHLAGIGPNRAPSPRVDPRAVLEAWRDVPLRLANLGYLGHMWELYAMWAWIGVFLQASFTLTMPAESAGVAAKLAAFATIASGAVGSVAAGLLADKLGRTTLTMAATPAPRARQARPARPGAAARPAPRHRRHDGHRRSWRHAPAPAARPAWAAARRGPRSRSRARRGSARRRPAPGTASSITSPISTTPARDRSATRSAPRTASSCSTSAATSSSSPRSRSRATSRSPARRRRAAASGSAAARSRSRTQSNIIMRHVRIRPGSETVSTEDDALSLYQAQQRDDRSLVVRVRALEQHRRRQRRLAGHPDDGHHHSGLVDRRSHRTAVRRAHRIRLQPDGLVPEHLRELAQPEPAREGQHGLRQQPPLQLLGRIHDAHEHELQARHPEQLLRVRAGLDRDGQHLVPGRQEPVDLLRGQPEGHEPQRHPRRRRDDALLVPGRRDRADRARGRPRPPPPRRSTRRRRRASRSRWPERCRAIRWTR